MTRNFKAVATAHPLLKTMTPQISTTRVQRLRDRRKKLGLVRVEFYLTPDQATKAKALIKKLTKETT